MEKLTIIIPAYNEESTICELLNKVQSAPLSIEKEIIVVDDGSTDNTLDVVSNISNIKVIAEEQNRGKGHAIKVGISQATGDIIIIQDADLEYDPNDYQSLIDPILKGEAEVVYGSRALGNSKKYHASFMFNLGGNGLTWFANFLYPGLKITDESTCYKVFKADVLKSIDLKCERFEFCPEVTAKLWKQGIKIHEVPIRYYPRSKKEGKKINYRDGFQALWVLFKERWRK